MNHGCLYLIPVPLGADSANASFTTFLQETINQIDEYIVENEKTARKFLKQAGLKIPQSELTIHDYGKHKRSTTSTKDYFKGLLAGKDVGLMSEAGCPGIADPGADIIAYAHKLGIKVVPLVGPSSVMLALMASGFNGQRFTFHGYLPIDKEQRRRQLLAAEQNAARYQETQIFIETPFRNNALLENILKICNDQTKLCVACNLTAEDELIISDTVKEWKKRKVDFHKKPAIFLLYR